MHNDRCVRPLIVHLVRHSLVGAQCGRTPVNYTNCSRTVRASLSQRKNFSSETRTTRNISGHSLLEVRRQFARKRKVLECVALENSLIYNQFLYLLACIRRSPQATTAIKRNKRDRYSVSRRFLLSSSARWTLAHMQSARSLLCTFYHAVMRCWQAP